MNFGAILEDGRIALGILLVLANIAVWYGVWLERESAPPEQQQKGWRILLLGLAGETALGFLLLVADTTIEAKQVHEIATANMKAERATKDAVDLARSFGGLHQFVTAEEKKNENALGELQAQAGALNKARSDALSAAHDVEDDLRKLEKTLADQRALTTKIERVTAERNFTVAQFNTLVTTLAKTPIEHVNVTPTWSSQEVVTFAGELSAAFDAAFKAMGKKPLADGESFVAVMPALDRPGFPAGITVEYSPDNLFAARFAMSLVELLNKDNLAARLKPTPSIWKGVTGHADPVSESAAIVTVWVGEVP